MNLLRERGEGKFLQSTLLGKSGLKYGKLIISDKPFVMELLESLQLFLLISFATHAPCIHKFKLIFKLPT